jgi:hypothetical protein
MAINVSSGLTSIQFLYVYVLSTQQDSSAIFGPE